MLDDQLLLARGDVHLIHVMEHRYAVVQAHQDGVRPLVADALHLHAHVVVLMQRLGFAGLEIDDVEVEVLVAALVLEIQDVLVVVGPEVLGDAPPGVGGDRLGILRAAGGGDPEVEHAIDGRRPGKVLAVGAELDGGVVGVTEEHVARDQVRLLGMGVGGAGREAAGDDACHSGEGEEGWLLVHGSLVVRGEGNRETGCQLVDRRLKA